LICSSVDQDVGINENGSSALDIIEAH
jgi:hypothetical protein